MIEAEMDIKMTTKKVIESLLSDNPALSISTDEEFYFLYGQITWHLMDVLGRGGRKGFNQSQHLSLRQRWQAILSTARNSKAQKSAVNRFITEFPQLIDLENRQLRNGLAMFFGYAPEKPVNTFGSRYYVYGVTCSSLFVKDATQFSDFKIDFMLD
ncbi:hypothetical protein [Paenibacillus terrae]|uniref:Uncharacterized protein n=1 Tax=Paenibacillus terrae TaxID=159743 RepID=A0A0D7WUG4_9BACL|nr:hypothetical protein [Paenibacillus terrae]KJD42795.1 hypothetical protein QD47_26240 [Paenibacillus terrae]